MAGSDEPTFPCFRNGYILLCGDQLASACCVPKNILVIDVSGTGVYHPGDSPVKSNATNGCYVAVEVYNEDGDRVGVCGQTHYEIELTEASVFKVRYHMMAWSGGYNEGCTLADFRVGCAGVVNGNSDEGDAASMSLNGATTDNEPEGCLTPAGAKHFTVSADPDAETVEIVEGDP